MYVPSNPHEAYKMGIEDAIREIQENMPLPRTKDPIDVLNSIPSFVRKKLLTKKVTKWINIWETGPSVSDPASVRFGTGVLYDDKSTAEANVIDPTRRDFLGTYPIEIETEI